MALVCNKSISFFITLQVSKFEEMVVDRRGFGVVGAIFAMVIAGLIVYTIVNYGPSIWHGIQSSGGGGGETVNILDLLTHPNQYLGKEITIEGNIMMIQQGYHMENWRNVYDNEWFVYIQQSYGAYWAQTTVLYPALTKYPDTTGVTFRFTGTVCNTDNSDTWLSTYTILQGGHYLKLSNVEIVSI